MSVEANDWLSGQLGDGFPFKATVNPFQIALLHSRCFVLALVLTALPLNSARSQDEVDIAEQIRFARQLLQNPELNNRRQGAVLLTKLGPKAKDAVPDLIKFLGIPDLHVEAGEALVAIGSGAVPELILAAQKSDMSMRSTLIHMLGRFNANGDSALSAYLCSEIRDKMSPGRTDAMRAATRQNPVPEALPILVAIVQDVTESQFIRDCAASAAARFGVLAEPIIPYLNEMQSKSSIGSHRYMAALRSRIAINPDLKSIGIQLAEFAADRKRSIETRISAVSILAEVGGQTGIKELENLLSIEDEVEGEGELLRGAALRALCNRSPTRRSVPLLIDMLSSSSNGHDALKALSKLAPFSEKEKDRILEAVLLSFTPPPEAATLTVIFGVTPLREALLNQLMTTDDNLVKGNAGHFLKLLDGR